MKNPRGRSGRSVDCSTHSRRIKHTAKLTVKLTIGLAALQNQWNINETDWKELPSVAAEFPIFESLHDASFSWKSTTNLQRLCDAHLNERF